MTAVTDLGAVRRSLYLDWEHSPGATVGVSVCPVCQARYQYHLVGFTPQGERLERLEVWHDHDLHTRLGVHYVGRNRSPSERAALETKLDAQEAAARNRVVVSEPGRVLAEPASDYTPVEVT